MLGKSVFITSPTPVGNAAYIACTKFTPKAPVRTARLLATALGLYTPRLNGKKPDERLFTPGYTAYNKRLMVQEYDLTDLLCAGENELSLEVAPGWAVSALAPWQGRGTQYHDHTMVRAELTLTYEDGTQQLIATNTDWQIRESAIRTSTLYHGETVDLTYPCRVLGMAKADAYDTELVANMGEPVRVCAVVHPKELIVTPSGERVIDFGQNLTGYVRVRLRAPRGTRVVLRHAEVLDRDGNFYEANMRSAKNECVYITDGQEHVFHPTYTFEGFRYIKLCEYTDEVCLADFTAVLIHSDMKRTGDFVCGNGKINQLYHNIVWGQVCNYLDIPTDCPQRDERLGWTGDAQVFCRTAAINFDVEEFFRKWLTDMILEQKTDGRVNGVIPIAVDNGASAAWADAACIIPMELYHAYGNREDLAACLPMMKKWVGYMRADGKEEYLWLGGTHFGDWLAMDGNEDDYVGQTPKDYIASAFFFHSARLTAAACRALGEDDSEYEELAGKVRAAFRARYMKDGFPRPLKDGSDSEPAMLTQTALVLALHFDLADPEEKPAIAKALAEMIRARGTKMTTGFVGTGYILHVLTDNGYTDLAYDLLFQTQNPSWLYSVEHGATTMWEHWNGVKADGTFWSDGMNSFNHYAYGAVYDWIFGVAAGISPIEPAYRAVRIAPHPDRRLGFCHADFESRSGTVRSHWYYKGDDVFYEISVADSVKAEIVLPSGYTETVCGGKHFYAEKAQ